MTLLILLNRNFVKCVKLGHSFFDLIKEQERIKVRDSYIQFKFIKFYILKKEKIDEEKRKTVTAMQIRSYEDSESDSDELSDDDIDMSLRRYFFFYLV